MVYYLYFFLFIYDNIVYTDTIFCIKDSKDINLHGHVSLDKEAGKAIGQGLSTIGSQIGLGATMVGVSTAVGKVIAKFSMPPVQKAGVVVGGALMAGFGHSIVSTINRNTISSENSSNFVNNSINPNVNKFIDDSSFSPLQVLLFDIHGINVTFLSLISILNIQLVFKFYLKDNVKKNLSSILGVYMNNKI